MALIQAAIVTPPLMFRLAALLTVTDCRLAAANARSDVPILPGAVHAGALTNVPVLLFPEESRAVVPPLSSKCQFAAIPLRTSPVSDGVAIAWAELALSPAALTAETT